MAATLSGIVAAIASRAWFAAWLAAFSFSSPDHVDESYSQAAQHCHPGIASTPATLTINVAGSNDAPVTVNDIANVQEDVTPSATGNVLPWAVLQFGGMGLVLWLALLRPRYAAPDRRGM